MNAVFEENLKHVTVLVTDTESVPQLNVFTLTSGPSGVQEVPATSCKYNLTVAAETVRVRNNRILPQVLAPDAHLSKSIPKRSERCQSCWTVQLGLSPVVSLGAAVTNEVAVGVCLLLHCAHKIM